MAMVNHVLHERLLLKKFTYPGAGTHTVHRGVMQHHPVMQQPPRYPYRPILGRVTQAKMNAITASKMHNEPGDVELDWHVCGMHEECIMGS